MKPPSATLRQSLVRRVETALLQQPPQQHQFHSSPAARAATRHRAAAPAPAAAAPSCTPSLLRSQIRRPFSSSPRRPRRGDPADEPTPLDPNFTSILDNPPQLVRTGRRHNRAGLLLLALIPATAFVLGTWQVQRLQWKTALLARLEDRLVREPLPLPPRVDPDAAATDFDYRRVVATGVLNHKREMLVGPRMRDGEDGYMVVTPLERPQLDGGDGSATVLINRGWISKKHRDQRSRGPGALPQGEVVVEGLLREPWKKNMFTPENRPDKNEFYFPDVKQMAEVGKSQAVWIEATMGEFGH
jgi:surfeit locus 1 family protein